MLVTILVFLLILSVLVLVHEAGHFFVAKFFKIKVEEFGFGLPPKAFGIKFGETLYSINWLPIGGFVKLYGEDEAGSGTVSLKPQKFSKKDIDRAYFSRPNWQKALVVSAGVVMNFILAVVIISFLFSAVGVPTPTEKVFVTQIIKNAPADKAGLKVGDLIQEVNGKKITTTLEVVESARQNLGKTVDLKVKTKNGKEEVLKLTPRKNYPKNQGPMGVAISEDVKIVKYPWYIAPLYGVQKVILDIPLIVLGFKDLIVSLVTKLVIPAGTAGPIGIAQLTGEVIKYGPTSVLTLLYMFSISLGVMNILPIPALDGGRLFFIIIETITRKKIDPKKEAFVHTVGMMVLLAFIAIISFNDIMRIFTGQSILPK